MRYRLLLIVIAAVTALSSFAQSTPVDTIYNPPVTYSGVPRTYELAGISVEGAPNYEDYIIIGYTGLRIGDRIEIPGGIDAHS